MTLRVLVLLVTGAALGLPALQSVAAQPDGSADNGAAIFGRARSVWGAMSYPPLLAYTVVVTSTAGSGHQTEHFAGNVTADGDFRVHAFSREEQANPTVPHGINVTYSLGIGIHSGGAAVGSADAPNASLAHGNLSGPPPPTSYGIPELSPLFSFGIRPCSRRNDRGDAGDSGLRVIGTVASVDRRYRVTAVGRETVDGRDAYHLALEPLVDAHRDRLRDVWIEAGSYDVVQARTLGNFTRGPESSIPWLIRFITIDGATYIASETSEGSVRSGPHTFEAVSVAFDDVKPEHGLTDIQFAIPADVDVPGAFHEPYSVDSPCAQGGDRR